MKKIALALGLLGFTVLANAADPLNGTVWKTIDDKTKQPKAIVKFTEQKKWLTLRKHSKCFDSR